MARPGSPDAPVHRVFRDRLVKALVAKSEPRIDTADALGVTTKAVQSWTGGRNLPNGIMLIRLCRHLEVSADWLLGLSNVREIAA